jgi:predicted GIY-YIG superfamily endonuclease
MMKLQNYKYQLVLKSTKIVEIIDSLTKTKIEQFEYPLTSDQYKVYVLCVGKTILYIGTTKDTIRNRLRSGLQANGKGGYHGYKWKKLSKVTLFVWSFENFDKTKIESIEAELALIIRNKTKKWPEYQNEIHFNNNFRPTGQLIAEKLFRQLTYK